ncbi:hypothetical protein [Hypericibacter sp.]|uniref:hypothetical protein n=1 Tax=Hypericibacter sp. TaxID=2705401 RepID=UPI003D6C9EF0
MFQRISLAVALTGALLLGACAKQYEDPPARQTSLIHPPPVVVAEPSPPEPVPMPAPAFPIPLQKPGSEVDLASTTTTTDMTATPTPETATPSGTPDATPDGGTTVAPEAADQTSSATAAPLIDRDDPKRLVGLNEAQTIGLLGDPFIAEERPPARIWTFSEAGCRLQVFFYPDLSDQHFEALTVAFSGIDDTDMARRACFEALLEKHGA